MPRNKNKLHNSLTITRKRLGLGQKQVAHLLKHKTTDQVSRYEKGYRIPGLKILLQFEIIYGIPARVVYGEFFEKLRLEIQDRAKIVNTIGNAKAVADSENLLSRRYCYYEELLRSPAPTQDEIDQTRKHVVLIMRRHAKLQ